MNAVARSVRRPAVAFVVDVALVVVFAAVGRTSHSEGLSLAGVLTTAWPFLAGTVVGWLVVRVRRRGWPVDVGPGVTVWFATLLVGMLLRWGTGAGTAVSFVLVAALVLALLLVGWRFVAAYRVGRARPAGRARS
jgi:peptidoglycan/LPS O-acetylase OafA/YrhL